MNIDIASETEARLTEEARLLDVSVDARLKRFIGERAALTCRTRAHRELSVWHLGSVGAPHRRAIHDDVS